jgi:hypothetical protein
MVGDYCGRSSRFVIHIFDEKHDDVRQSRFSLWPQLWLLRQAELGDQSPTPSCGVHWTARVMRPFHRDRSSEWLCLQCQGLATSYQRKLDLANQLIEECYQDGLSIEEVAYDLGVTQDFEQME